MYEEHIFVVEVNTVAACADNPLVEVAIVHEAEICHRPCTEIFLFVDDNVHLPQMGGTLDAIEDVQYCSDATVVILPDPAQEQRLRLGNVFREQ